MQVTHKDAHVTHAVIGGKQTIDFGISNSAEFFHILSSTLYSDQIMAVVREVLCNAWDAHIEAGFDLPVQVTLTKDKFVIRDFGNGIHHDDMGPIYGTYGNSTKKNDGKQTGGFGLGCKAPFAYTDHFEVISCHAGTKTIYTLSRSSAQADGKPGITPIASFPTNETGLQVSIGIKNYQDFVRFDSLVKRIAFNGDMNVLLNGEKLPTMQFDGAANYYTVRSISSMKNPATRVLVRYGNVIYPVAPDTRIEKEHERVLTLLNKVGSNRQFCLVFQAPPHSIAVTPSRESLSMQDHTVNTLNSLFKKFSDEMDAHLLAECAQHVKVSADELAAKSELAPLFQRYRALACSIKPSASSMDKMDSATDMAKHFMAWNYPDSHEFHKEDIKYRLRLLLDKKVINQGEFQTFMRELGKSVRPYTERRANQENCDWLSRRVIAPLLVKLSQAKMDTARLFVCDPLDLNSPTRFHSGRTLPPLVPAKTAHPLHPIAVLPYLRHIVVLATARTTMEDRAFAHPVFKELGKTHGFLFYHVGMKKEEKAAARDFFSKSGLRVVDLIDRQKWEDPPESRNVGTKKAVKKGVVSLSHLLYGSDYLDISRINYPDAPRTETPEFVVKVSARQGSSCRELDGFNNQASVQIAKLFGDKGGVVTTEASLEAWKKKGAKDFRKYLIEKVTEYVTTSKTLHDFYAKNPENLERTLDYENLRAIQTILKSPTLCKEFSINKPELNEQDKRYLIVWRAMDNNHRMFSHYASIKETQDKIGSIPMDPPLADLVEKVCTRPLLHLIELSSLAHLLDSPSTKKPDAEKALHLLHAALA